MKTPEDHQPGLPDFESESFFRLDNLPCLPRRSDSALFGNGRWANEDDLRDYLDPSGRDDDTYLSDASLLLESGNGTLKGLFKRDFYFPADIRRSNILAVGQIGSGKTERLIVPLAVSDIKTHCSMVLVDLKGDLHQRLAPFVEKYRPGTKIKVLNLSDRKRTTHAWNPFSNVDLSDATVLEDVQAFLAAADERGGHDSPFWDGSAARWIVAIAHRLKQKNGAVCPADVHAALELPRGELLALLQDGEPVPFANTVVSFLESAAHNAETVLATAQMYFRIFADPELAAVTSTDELSFEDLLEEGEILIIEVEESAIERFRPVLNLFFTHLFRSAYRTASKHIGNRLPVPLNIHMDDFATAMGKIPGMAENLNMGRSRNVRVVAAIQSLSQIHDFYGKSGKSVIAGFKTLILFSPVTIEDAKWASEHTGTATVDSVETHQELSESGEWQPKTRTIRPISRPVILPEEIRMSPEHFVYGRAATILLPDAPAFQAWLRCAYDTPGLAEPMGKALAVPRAESLRSLLLEWKGRCVDAGSFTNVTGMSKEAILEQLDRVRNELDIDSMNGNAREWWDAFESENISKPSVVLRVAEELRSRNATITELFLAYVYSNTDNIQGNLHYLDYTRLKKFEEKKRREQQG